MHENRLYVFEGTTPNGGPDSSLFQASIGFVDADGNSLRYMDYYSNAIHGLRQYDPPPVTRERSGALVGTADAADSEPRPAEEP